MENSAQFSECRKLIFFFIVFFKYELTGQTNKKWCNLYCMIKCKHIALTVNRFRINVFNLQLSVFKYEQCINSIHPSFNLQLLKFATCLVLQFQNIKHVYDGMQTQFLYFLHVTFFNNNCKLIYLRLYSCLDCLTFDLVTLKWDYIYSLRYQKYNFSQPMNV